ncbi:ankyrin repeat-containing domain protein [Leptodontidium sp. MPI-SDFR-AT-0119]|nr:ankyrin repeat-containing domain protein [Leptodontidium sp. MPI-SDFR-AT-0119]
MAEILTNKYPGAKEELLFWAAEKGYDAVVKLLLEKGANTPLLSAAMGGHEAVVKLLLEKDANVDTAYKNDGQTPLSSAAARGHEDVVKLLLEKGAHPLSTMSP